MPQEQRTVRVHFSDGNQQTASATGNNAAWLCPCGRELPLIGRSGLAEGVTDGYRVDCPDCSRCYFVVPENHDLDRAARVEEVHRP